MVLQLLFNITLFLCTAYQIRKLQRETAAQITKGESRKFNRLEADKDRYGLINVLLSSMFVSSITPAQPTLFRLSPPVSYPSHLI